MQCSAWHFALQPLINQRGTKRQMLGTVFAPPFLQHGWQRIISWVGKNVHFLFHTAFFVFVESPFCRPKRLC